MKRWTILLVGAACAALAACASTGGTADPAKTLAATEATLTGAIEAAQQYEALPACAPGSPIACSDPATVTRIQAAAETASSAVLAAQVAISNGSSAAAQAQAVSSATAAVTSLSTLVPTTRK